MPCASDGAGSGRVGGACWIRLRTGAAADRARLRSFLASQVMLRPYRTREVRSTSARGAVYSTGMSQDIIYGLRDPRTNQIRYIGRSSSWKTRPDQHRRDARRPSDQSPKSVWIRELIDAGLDYEMIVMEQCDTREASMDAERKWIAEGWRLGWPLFNRTHAPSGATYVSAETREKIAATKRGKPRYDLRGKPNPKVAEAQRNRPRTEEFRAKMRAINAARRGISGPLKGIPLSAEHKARISAGKTGKPWSLARRESYERSLLAESDNDE